MKISAAIITRDAAAALDRCLASLDFCDEVVVLDQHSADQTAAVCARRGARLVQTEWLGFGPTKQKAVDLCRNRWVLSIDSDEQVSAELRAAILALPDEPAAAAFAVNRLSRFLGHWIRHCGWHPDWVVRLFDRERAAFDAKPVHEAVHARGPVERLGGLLLHDAYETLEAYIARLDRYTTAAAAELHQQGRRSGLGGAWVRSQAAFWRMWLLQGGFRDGWPGTVLCACSSFYVLSKYVKLWRLDRP
ncbi:MAG TPA: glycosyltransferase family 2 protein [Candidatus Krumholzibacteria bacterium]|nr:glycosyltransferase family 2 protein [Candidatus Krumholzibacteria bacterium]HPD72371.1 glycosyltransferase family 2 protein [Candidatus Krumholzibacteria bacterium]HRY40697.1 glycosyltransferase family 2 protein [Candidatus Krumholzibacteria bacterium]